MKKVLISSIIALALVLGSTASANAAFSAYLTVGSTGADVSALQTWLISQGFAIPAISNGAAQTGYFGQQTKAAVVKYQASVGLPATGFVGPLTIAKLNGGAVAMAPVACPAGYTCTANPGTTPVTPATPGVITTPGVAGTLAVSLQGSPSGASLDKGESEDVVRYKLQAAASDMQVTSIAIDFDARLWLYASSITIKDDNGAVVAQKNNLNANDFTELTVGSDYRLYVPVNYVVPRTQSKYLTVSLTMLGISDRDSATITINDLQVRSVDGTGVTDTQSVSDDRTFSYTGTNTGSIIATISPSAPLKRLVQISNSTQTNDVVIGKFDLKSQNRDSVVRTLKVYINTDGTSVNTLFTRVKIMVDGQSYTANTTDTSAPNTTSSSTLTFSDLKINLVKDTPKTITVLGDVAQPSSIGALDGKMASTTIKANGANVVAEDNTYNSITVNSGTLTSSDSIFSASGAVLSNMSAVVGTANQGSIGGVSGTVSKDVSFTYTITAGDNTLYVAAAPNTALATTSTGYGSAANASTTITSVTATPSEVAGDSAGTYFIVPAGGSRTFRWAGTMQYDAPRGTVLRTFYVTSVKYDTDTTNLNDNTINYNLGALKVETAI